MYEIERKFLVDKNKLPKNFDKIIKIKQGYIFDADNGILRIRQENNRYILTIKLNEKESNKRIEIEKKLNKKEFDILWEKAKNKIEKIRKIIYNSDGTKWEIDFFQNLTGKYKNLILAEIELKDINQKIKLPNWIIKEVTNDYNYYNNNLGKYSDINNNKNENLNCFFEIN